MPKITFETAGASDDERLAYQRRYILFAAAVVLIGRGKTPTEFETISAAHLTAGQQHSPAPTVPKGPGFCLASIRGHQAASP